MWKLKQIQKNSIYQIIIGNEQIFKMNIFFDYFQFLEVRLNSISILSFFNHLFVLMNCSFRRNSLLNLYFECITAYVCDLHKNHLNLRFSVLFNFTLEFLHRKNSEVNIFSYYFVAQKSQKKITSGTLPAL